MAALITETVYNVSPNLGGKMMKFEAATTATGDWLVFDDPIGAVKVNEIDGSDAVTAYGAGTCDETIDSAATEMEYDAVTAAQLPATNGYVMIGTEIMGYAAGGAAADSDLTGLTRGCFGTTAASHTDGDAMYILNTIVVTLDAAGPVRGIADIIEE